MLSLANGPIEVKILCAGSNWLKVGSMIGLGLTGYFSPLPKGSTVSVNTMHSGEACLAGPGLVDAGKYHFGITTPPWLARTAAEGRGARGFAEKPLRLRAVAVLPHFDQLALAVRKDLGITSIRQLKDQKVPLKMSTAPIHIGHPVGWVLDMLLAEYGMEIEDFERWGGMVTSGDRQPNFLEKVPAGRRDRVSAMKDGTLNAVFDEALMTLPWKQIADAVDLTFLPVERDVLQALDRKYGIRATTIPKGSLRGVDRDLPCIDFAGWIIYCREDLPDDLVYMAVGAIEQQRLQIESLFQPGQGLTDSIDMSKIWRGTELPLHPGAERYYREKGYMR
ncbi:MAG: TAXI family TRAP transporter solute-binding subunit [Alphaproteobacteria bacterium]